MRQRQPKVGSHVRIMSMGRIAIGRVTAITGNRADVRLPNWMADGVHLDIICRMDELETGHGRAEKCRCPYCGGRGDFGGGWYD